MQQSPTFLAPRVSFMEDKSSRDRGGGGDGFGMIQVCITFKLTSCCAARFLTGRDWSDPWSGGWGPLLYRMMHHQGKNVLYEQIVNV